MCGDGAPIIGAISPSYEGEMGLLGHDWGALDLIIALISLAYDVTSGQQSGCTNRSAVDWSRASHTDAQKTVVVAAPFSVDALCSSALLRGVS